MMDLELEVKVKSHTGIGSKLLLEEQDTFSLMKKMEARKMRMPC